MEVQHNPVDRLLRTLVRDHSEARRSALDVSESFAENHGPRHESDRSMAPSMATTQP